MSQESKTAADIGEAIMKAFRDLGGSEGLSLDAIKKHLSSICGKMPDSKSILSSINEAVEKGLLTKLDNGKYKIKEAARHVKDMAQGASSKVSEGKDKIKESAEKLGQAESSKLSNGKVKMEETKKKVEELSQNASSKLSKIKEDTAEKTEQLVQDSSSKVSEGKEKIKETAKNVEDLAQDATSKISKGKEEMERNVKKRSENIGKGAEKNADAEDADQDYIKKIFKKDV